MKAKHVKKATPHPWEELSKTSSLTVSQLKILHIHHTTLHRFCVDPEKIENETMPSTEGSIGDNVHDTAAAVNQKQSMSETSIEIPFEHYAQCIHTLLKHGTPAQQLGYLFHTYAMESERGISRSELYQLLKDHYKSNGVSAPTKSSGGISSTATEVRYFERLYTWLKKHFIVYDRARCGFLSLPITMDMLGIHPDALYNFQFQVEPFIAKLDENNKQYEVKAKATAIQM